MFLAQALSQDRSCQRAVDEATIKRLVVRLKSTCTTVVADGDGTSAGASWVSSPCVHSTAFFAFMARLSALPLSVA